MRCIYAWGVKIQPARCQTYSGSGMGSSHALAGLFLSIGMLARYPPPRVRTSTSLAQQHSVVATLVEKKKKEKPRAWARRRRQIAFATMNPVAKWILPVANMLFGRLEVFTLLVLFTPTFWRE